MAQNSLENQGSPTGQFKESAEQGRESDERLLKEMKNAWWRIGQIRTRHFNHMSSERDFLLRAMKAVFEISSEQERKNSMVSSDDIVMLAEEAIDAIMLAKRRVAWEDREGKNYTEAVWQVKVRKVALENGLNPVTAGEAKDCLKEALRCMKIVCQDLKTSVYKNYWYFTNSMQENLCEALEGLGALYLKDPESVPVNLIDISNTAVGLISIAKNRYWLRKNRKPYEALIDKINFRKMALENGVDPVQALEEAALETEKAKRHGSMFDRLVGLS